MVKMSGSNVEKLARIVYGEARGEPEVGQLAVADTVVNRVNHSGYPNSLDSVIPDHDRNWQQAKAENNSEYQRAVRVAEDALTGRKSDPTNGATCFATSANNPAVTDNQYYRATNLQQIGNHYFVGRQARH
ncbi:hypothetical protein KUTeg_021154 [Tegillarca granosa]|uniref:Cell wall hydrolase SleB domain-containing protein n=1 Tax=Tegillarca granosa TaxID=220873 RepID=A0ABQ9EA23_TEGGR|nr:hypothetical protein KUTeg_021154 [Tegillarca granosa]